jgi:hypothetical protein
MKVKKRSFVTRPGKIARLPLSIREQINHRLENNEEAKQIAAWLNTLFVPHSMRTRRHEIR